MSDSQNLLGTKTVNEIEYEVSLLEFQHKCIRARDSNETICKLYEVEWIKEKNMTPREELFAELFKQGKMKVKDMNTLEMRAFREKLVNIAYEAKATIYAVDDEEKERAKAAKKDKGVTGFERSINTDDVTSDAINKINERKKKMSKMDKVKEGLIAMGMSEEDANKAVDAGTILNHLRNKGDTKPAGGLVQPFQNTTEQQVLVDAAIIEENKSWTDENKKQAEDRFNRSEDIVKETPKPLFNPFVK